MRAETNVARERNYGALGGIGFFVRFTLTP